MVSKDKHSIVLCMLLIGFCSVGLLSSILSSEAHGQVLAGGTPIYGTVSERDSGRYVVVVHAILSFLGPNEVAYGVTTNENGEYSIKLPSGTKYSLTVTRQGFCPAHRPPFDAQAERKVRFDIVLTTTCPKDLVGVSRDESESSSLEIEFCAKAGIYYCEEQVTIDTRSPVTAVIGFVSRRVEDGRILYGSNSKRSTALRQQANTTGDYSVLVAFDTYTIRATSVILDLQKKTLSARGNVSIIHNDEEISVGSPCMNVHFEDQGPAVRPCD